MTRVLVVQRDHDLAEQYAAWLRQAGFDVILCGGPWPPTYYCPLMATGACSLCAEADIFVYDPWLYVQRDKVSAVELIRELRRAYPHQPVLLTWGQEGMPAEVAPLLTDPWIREAPNEPPALVEAVKAMLTERQRSSSNGTPGPQSAPGP